MGGRWECPATRVVITFGVSDAVVWSRQALSSGPSGTQRLSTPAENGVDGDLDRYLVGHAPYGMKYRQGLRKDTPLDVIDGHINGSSCQSERYDPIGTRVATMIVSMAVGTPLARTDLSKPTSQVGHAR